MLKISTEIYFLFRFHPVEIKRAKSCPRRPTYPKSKIGKKKNLVVFLNYQHRGRNLELGFRGIKKKNSSKKKLVSPTNITILNFVFLSNFFAKVFSFLCNIY